MSADHNRMNKTRLQEFHKIEKMQESNLHIWHGKSVVQLSNLDFEDLEVIKTCSINNNIFLLTSSGSIYYGILSQEEDLHISFKKIKLSLLDISCTLQQIYFVNNSGNTLSCTPEIFCNASEPSQLQMGSSGMNTISSEDLHARSLCIGARGVAYIDDNDMLWASGWQKELGIDDVHFDSKPSIIEVFSGRHVIDVSLGADFGLVLLQPIDKDYDSSPKVSAKVAEKTSNLNSVIANVDAATVYLKRQLSLVSEDVVGFVKNVGDFVPYRQKSESISSESFEELAVEHSSVSEAKSLINDSQENSCNISRDDSIENMCATLQIPSKTGSSSTLCSRGSSSSSNRSRSQSQTHDSSDAVIVSSVSNTTISSSSQGSEAERAWALAKAGIALLETEVWSWGDSRCGQLGLGDMVRRNKPTMINRLKKCGVRKIVCGSHYALALLLDGRVFIWGERKSATGSTLDSSPKQLELPGKLRAYDITACNDVSYILADRGKVFMLDRHDDIVELIWPNREGIEQAAAYHVLSSGQLCVCILSDKYKLPDSQFNKLTKEQQLLEDMIEVRRLLLQKISSTSQEVQVLLRCHQAVMGVTARRVAALAQVPCPVRPHSETIVLYNQFLTALCDAIACGALHQAVVADHDKKAAVLATLSRPLDHISVFAEEAKAESGSNSDEAKAWKKLLSESKAQLKSAEMTREFWESLSPRISWKVQLQEGGRHRRLVRDSRTHNVSLIGAGRFSGPHWFLLMSDCLVHVAGSQIEIHNLRTLWVDPITDTVNLQNSILVTTPESSLTLNFVSAKDRSEWLNALYSTIKSALPKPHSRSPPVTRNARYTFTKNVAFKGATYQGRWVKGLPEGPGHLEWIDGKIYKGSFHAGQMHGRGQMTYPDGSSYVGQWVEGLQSGYGIEKNATGDVYEGYFVRGQPNGHGVRKEGRFLSSAASVYVGEWACGRRHGYGVSDDISTGEKYLGLWSNGLKHGCGMVVTLDGIYYEGTFANGNLTGRGVMVWEDGSCYEGEFGSSGVFAGKGRLSLSSGDQFEGTFHGAWNEGVKVNGMFHKCVNPPTNQDAPKPSLFGRLSVLAGEKWRPIFRECLRQLNIPGGEESTWEPGGVNTARAWEGVAVALNQNQSKNNASSLDTIPQYGRVTLDAETYDFIKGYLSKAFEERAHPLGLLIHLLTDAYTATYGGVRVHPVLLKPAVAELLSLSTRLYQLVRLLFPALPPAGHEAPLLPKPSPSMPDIARHQAAESAPRARALSASQEETGDLCESGETVALQDMSPGKKFSQSGSLIEAIQEIQISDCSHELSRRSSTLSNISDGDIMDDREVASAAGLLLPLLLPRVHSALFVLYALHNKAQDDEYWKKLLKWNKQRDVALMAFLGIERCFWPEEVPQTGESNHMFVQAVECLQQLKTTFAPIEKLMVIRSTFQLMTKAVQNQVGSEFLWTMDVLLPVFQFIVIKAQILQLGSEIHFVEDFMEPHLLNGELGIMFTTLKASYYQILQERIN